MKPEDIVNKVKKEREEILFLLENRGDEVFVETEIVGELGGHKKDDRKDKRKIVLSVMRNLSDLWKEKKIGKISARGEKWYGTNQATAKLQEMLDEIKK